MVPNVRPADEGCSDEASRVNVKHAEPPTMSADLLRKEQGPLHTHSEAGCWCSPVRRVFFRLEVSLDAWSWEDLQHVSGV